MCSYRDLGHTARAAHSIAAVVSGSVYAGSFSFSFVLFVLFLFLKVKAGWWWFEWLFCVCLCRILTNNAFSGPIPTELGLLTALTML